MLCLLCFHLITKIHHIILRKSVHLWQIEANKCLSSLEVAVERAQRTKTSDVGLRIYPREIWKLSFVLEKSVKMAFLQQNSLVNWPLDKTTPSKILIDIKILEIICKIIFHCGKLRNLFCFVFGSVSPAVSIVWLLLQNKVNRNISEVFLLLLLSFLFFSHL